jgi:oxalate decarboxylase
VVEGQAGLGVFGGQGQARTFDLQAGDVGYVPFAMGHYLENTGPTPFVFLELFKSPYFLDVSLDTWMALTPPELVKAHLNLDQQVMDGLHKAKVLVMPK